MHQLGHCINSFDIRHIRVNNRQIKTGLQVHPELGAFLNADAMFAPVVNRFEIYQLSKAPAVQAYSDSIKCLPAWLDWQQAGISEPWICENVEV